MLKQVPNWTCTRNCKRIDELGEEIDEVHEKPSFTTCRTARVKRCLIAHLVACTMLVWSFC